MGKPISQQIAALPWRKGADGVEILLVTSRETKRWVIPKGWPMDHLVASNAAKQEAYEEAGIAGCIRRAAIGHYTYDKRAGDGSSRACVVTVYPFRVLQEHKAWPEDGERQRRWFSANDAAAKVKEAGLRAIILTFGKGQHGFG